MAISQLPHPVAAAVDAKLLLGNAEVSVRQLSAVLCMREPDRYRDAVTALAKDTNHRVRITLAEAAIHAATRPQWLEDILGALRKDNRHSVRTAATRLCQ